MGEVFDPSDLELFLIPICRGVVAVNDIDEWDDESASDYTIVRCANEEREALGKHRGSGSPVAQVLEIQDF